MPPRIYLTKAYFKAIWGAICVRCYIEERTVELAKYIIKNKCTVREAAKKFGISKSTVHTVRVT